MAKEWLFRNCGDYLVRLEGPPGCSESVSLEYLYTVFKERLMTELAVRSPELLGLGEIVERDPNEP